MWKTHGQPLPPLSCTQGQEDHPPCHSVSPPAAPVAARFQCPHATGCHPEAASQGAKNTCCSLQMLGSCSRDSGRPGECWGWASLRSGALLCLLTPSWVCLWPGSAADAACRSAQAGRDGLPAAGTAARGQGASPQQWLCAPLTLAQPPLHGRWENGEGAQGGVARRSTEEFAGSPRSRQIKALRRAPERGRQMEAELRASLGLWESLCQKRDFFLPCRGSLGQAHPRSPQLAQLMLHRTCFEGENTEVKVVSCLCQEKCFSSNAPELC